MGAGPVIGGDATRTLAALLNMDASNPNNRPGSENWGKPAP